MECKGECQKCTMQQQLYCATARLYAFMQHEPVLFERIEKIEKALAGLASNEITPIGAGAENTAPETELKTL